MTDWIQGIDISKHQGEVDFVQVGGAGLRFVYCKATEGAADSDGNGYLDPSFRANWARLVDPATNGRLLRGAYHFARPDNTSRGCGRAGGVAEAEWFCKVLREVGHYGQGCLPPALDYEKNNDCSAADNIAWIRGFLDTVEQQLGRKAVIYIGPNICESQLGGTDAFVGELLWTVTWSATSLQPRPMPTGGKPWAWTFWQWSAGGSSNFYGQVPGLTGACDINRFNGDEAALEVLALLRPAVEPVTLTTAQLGPPPPIVDLAQRAGGYDSIVARVQGLLLAHGYGPAGLVARDGRPDGKFGDSTAVALITFKQRVGLPADTVVDWQTWWALVTSDLG